MTLWYALCDALGAEFLSMNFMKNALLAVIVMAPLFGLLSTMIVEPVGGHDHRRLFVHSSRPRHLHRHDGRRELYQIQ